MYNTYICKHIRTPHIRTHMHIHASAPRRVFETGSAAATRSHTHTHIHTHIHKCAHFTYLHVCVCVCVRACICIPPPPPPPHTHTCAQTGFLMRFWRRRPTWRRRWGTLQRKKRCDLRNLTTGASCTSNPPTPPSAAALGSLTPDLAPKKTALKMASKSPSISSAAHGCRARRERSGLRGGGGGRARTSSGWRGGMRTSVPRRSLELTVMPAM